MYTYMYVYMYMYMYMYISSARLYFMPSDPTVKRKICFTIRNYINEWAFYRRPASCGCLCVPFAV